MNDLAQDLIGDSPKMSEFNFKTTWYTAHNICFTLIKWSVYYRDFVHEDINPYSAEFLKIY